MSDLSSIPVAAIAEPPVIHRLGEVPYAPTLERMQAFTRTRDSNTRDELWLLEHPPVYTAGIAAKTEHWPRFDNGIPVVRIDRGGQITYHGPGQLVAYLLLDLRRRNLSVRPLVRRMEQAVVDMLAGYGITAHGRPDAPGVYVGAAKIAALGLRIRNGCCYHGLALNVDVDLAPFNAINPCGYPGMEVIRTRDLGITDSRAQIGERLLHSLLEKLQ
ncbi:MAG: lipoyl(octanoyl) transferase LipB [Burkholderiales bacterium]